MRKAIILFSGGLDSVLCAKILRKQKIKLLGISFKSYFFNDKQARKSAKAIKLPLEIIDISKQQLGITKNPIYGYGKNMNPCVDCRILMFNRAKRFMKEKNFDFIATGEVLGQRPMSQNKQTMELIETASGLKGYILRPLSAKLLDPCIPETMKWVDREQMLDIRGRTRKPQIRLAKKYKLKDYVSPSGGCLLTDPEFSRRLRALIDVLPSCAGSDIELLKTGRHIWAGKSKIVIGRNQNENNEIKKLSLTKDILIEMEHYPGPLCLIRNYGKTKITNVIINKAEELTKFYALKARNKKDVRFIISRQ